ncbi:hypothetical protein SDC9_73142 [bioreactor metagenome]|uniref:Uncharacterized protein n=1 Tax=bioreactor metagenome TaxID=1076179 RepID=A0A644YF90_9ZZZZ
MGEFLALQFAPAVLVLPKAERGFHLIHRVDLAVAEVIDKRVEEQLQELLDIGVLLKRILLQQQRADRKDGAVEYCHEEEREHEPDVHHAEQERNRDEDIPECLDERARELKDPIIRQANRADAPVLGIEEHLLVPEQCVDQTDMPAFALLFQVGELFRRLRPADGVRQEAYGVFALLVVHELMQLDHQLHILADAIASVAARFDDGGLVECAERAGDDEQHAHHVEADSTGQKRAQVFSGLQRNNGILRKPNFLELAVFNFATAADADDAADGDAGRVADKRVDDFDERALLENGVRVDGNDNRVGSDVDARVESVGFAAVLLIENDQFFIHRGTVDFQDFFRDKRLFIWLAERKQLERVDEQLERVVLGAVVDHDDFVLRKVE